MVVERTQTREGRILLGHLHEMAEEIGNLRMGRKLFRTTRYD